MYLGKLFNLARDIPDLTERNLTNIDNFLGAIGTHNVFTKNQFISELTQKRHADSVLDWLTKNEILKVRTVRCPSCRKSISASDKICFFCGTQIVSAETDDYEIIAELTFSSEEKEVKENKRFKLDKSCFDIMLKRLDQKIRRKEDSYIIFSDIASSTALKEINFVAREKICRGVPEFLRKITLPFFRSHNGIYIKSEGDASYILLDSLPDVCRFMRNVVENIASENFYSDIMSVNEEIKNKIEKTANQEEKGELEKDFVFIKFYVAKSTTGQYTQTDILSIDFDNTLESIVFIKRIEKAVKCQILRKETDLTVNVPLCIFSRDNDFNGSKKNLENVSDYKDVIVWYSDYECVESFVGDKQ